MGRIPWYLLLSISGAFAKSLGTDSSDEDGSPGATLPFVLNDLRTFGKACLARILASWSARAKSANERQFPRDGSRASGLVPLGSGILWVLNKGNSRDFFFDTFLTRSMFLTRFDTFLTLFEYLCSKTNGLLR